MTAKQPTTEQPSDDLDRQPDQAVNADAEQRELWRRYLEQQARLSCPGCGDDAAVF